MECPTELVIEGKKYLRADTVQSVQPPSGGPYDRFLGKNVFIRTVTMNYIGRLVEVHEHEIVLAKCSWVAWPPELFSDLLKKGPSKDVEPFPGGVALIGRGAIVDCGEYFGALVESPLR